MYLDILDQMICPACNEDLIVEKILIKEPRGSRTDFSEGLLSCNGGESHTFLVVDGVALLVNDLTSYLSSKKNIVSELLQAATTSEAKVFIAEHLSKVDELESNEWESSTLTSAYIWSHFDSSWEDPLGSSVETKRIDTGELFSSKHLMEVVQSFLPNGHSESSVGIDIGSSVGGNTHSLSKVTSVAIGCDYSFRAIRTAREIRDMEDAYEYELPIEGQHTETRSIDVEVPNPETTEFVVADAKALPFKDHVADTVLSINMVDTFPDPVNHLNEANRLLAKGGRLITCDPYQWDSHPEDLLGKPENDRTPDCSEEALRRTISGELGHELVNQQRHVPWTLKFNSRFYPTWIVDCIASQKPLESNQTK